MASTAAAAWYLVPTKYTASTLLHVESFQPSILFNPSESRNNFINYQRTQAAIIKSRMVLNAALRQPKVPELRTVRKQVDPVQWLEREVKTDYALAPEVLRISISGDDPDDLTVMANAVRDAYLREVVDKEKNDRLRRLDQLKRLNGDYGLLLKDRRQTLRGLAENIGTQDAKTAVYKQQFAVERLALAQKELLQLQSDLRKAQVEAAGLPDKEKSIKNLEVPAELVDEAIRRDKVVEQQAVEVSRLEGEYHATKDRLAKGEADPLLRPYKARLDAARSVLTARQEAIRPTVVEQLRAKAVRDVIATSSQLQARVQLLKNLEGVLAEDIKRVQQDTQNLNKGALDLESLREEIARAEDTEKRAGSQMEALTVELQAPSRVTLLEEAFVSDGDSQKKRLMGAGGAGAAALGLVMGGLTWREMRARRVGTTTEVTSSLNVRVLGQIPPLRLRRSGVFGFGRTTSDPAPQLMEAVDATRTVLLSALNGESLRCVMVTSASSGEGKTSISSHLATSLARIGYQTLLIDGDLRRPAVHRVFDLPLEAGLAEVLRGEIDLTEAAQVTGIDCLSIITAGRCDDLSLQALAREAGRDVFHAVRDRYDYVIVDSPPVLPVADALLIGRYVDGVIMSVLRDVTRIPTMLAAHERLSVLGIRVLGTVVSGMAGDGYGPHCRYQYATAPAGQA